MISPFATITEQTSAANHENAIAFCVDGNYLPYALFVAIQILNTETTPIDICICVPDLTIISEQLRILPIRFVEIDVQNMQDLPTDHLSIAAYYRLFLPSIFKDDYEYIVYLDADVYICRPFIHDLFSWVTNNKEFSVAAAAYIGEIELSTFPDTFNKNIKNYLSRYHELNHVYRNSGVLVFDVDNYHKNYIQEHIFLTAKNNPEKLESHDQSALNLTLLTDIAQLPLTFNWQLNRFSHQATQHFNPYIIHFVNVNKPWITCIDYIEKYIPEYRFFMNKYFPERDFIPLTEQEKRIIKPKYKGMKEVISKNWHILRITRKQSKINKKYRNKKVEIIENISKTVVTLSA